MFERFTAGSPRVMILTQEECRLLRHDCITPAHLLLGVLAEGGGVAAQALATLGVSLERARDVVADLVAPGEVAAPWPRLAVAAAEVTVEAFDRYSGELTPSSPLPSTVWPTGPRSTARAACSEC
jgi:ATP-dependent Clp protease ATP-binding subunit ClpA